ncbi:MAG: CvpA family protein, partial [Flavitalea sp.]
IVGIFSLVAIIAGLAASLKLSSVVAIRMGESTGISARWIPVLSFLAVFIGVVLLVNIGAKIIEQAVEMMMLGVVNKIAGVFLYVILHTIIFSILLFYATQLSWIGDQTIRDSRVYGWVQPVGPFIINGLGKLFPMFSDLFEQLKEFFQKVSEKIPEERST